MDQRMGQKQNKTKNVSPVQFSIDTSKMTAAKCACAKKTAKTYMDKQDT